MTTASDRTGSQRRLGRLARWGLHGVVALALLGLVLWQADPRELGDQLGRFAVAPAIGVVLLNIPVLLVLTVRGQYILRQLGYRVIFGSLLPISILGNVAGAMTPASAGDLLRTPFFRERHQIPYAQGLATVLYERGYSFFILALSTGVAAAWSTLPLGAALGTTAAGLAGILAAPRAAALALDRLRDVLPGEDAEGKSPARRALSAGSRPLGPLLLLLRSGPLTAYTVTTSLAVFGLMTVQMWLIGRALDLELGPEQSWLALGSSLMAGIITFLPLGLGSLDATLAAVVGTTEEGFGAGAAAAVLLRLTITLPLGLAALASYGYLVAGGRRQPSGADTQGFDVRATDDRVVRD